MVNISSTSHKHAPHAGAHRDAATAVVATYLAVVVAAVVAVVVIQLNAASAFGETHLGVV
jgi:hypothetical protein